MCHLFNNSIEFRVSKNSKNFKNWGLSKPGKHSLTYLQARKPQKTLRPQKPRIRTFPTMTYNRSLNWVNLSCRDSLNLLLAHSIPSNHRFSLILSHSNYITSPQIPKHHCITRIFAVKSGTLQNTLSHSLTHS